MNPEPLAHSLMWFFQKSAEQHFGKAAKSFDSSLERVSTQLYGFLTKHAVVMVGVYHGHNPSLCVKLRERRPEDARVTEDETGMIGLGVLKRFMNPHAPLEMTETRITTTESLEAEIESQAAQLLSWGQPFLDDPYADWNGLRKWLDERIAKNHQTTEKKVEPGEVGDYTGVFSMRDSWITMELVHRFLTFGKIERWFPVFECAIPSRLKSAIDSRTGREQFFEVSFRGIPSEKGRFGREGSCIRKVRILQI